LKFKEEDETKVAEIKAKWIELKENTLFQPVLNLVQILTTNFDAYFSD